MRVEAPEPDEYVVIDYDIRYSSGATEQFTLRPDLGDREERTDEKLIIIREKTFHHVEIWFKDIAALSRREFKFKKLPEEYQSPQKAAKKGLTTVE